MATKRLTDANDLWTDIMMLPHNGEFISSEEVEQAIKDAPTVDAVEVVHGRWDKNWSGDNIVYCNQCYMPQDVPTPYCAGCGAKMDGDGNG